MKKASNLVKQLSDDVQKGVASKKDLSAALEDLNQKSYRVKILTAESKILGGWTQGDLTTAPPPEKYQPSIIHALALIALFYLLLG